MTDCLSLVAESDRLSLSLVAESDRLSLSLVAVSDRLSVSRSCKSLVFDMCKLFAYDFLWYLTGAVFIRVNSILIILHRVGSFSDVPDWCRLWSKNEIKM